jgi:hypothetical protein
MLKLMDRVAGDGRHHDLRVVYSSRGPRLLGGPWSMAVVQCQETSWDMEERVRLLKTQVDEGRQFSPSAMSAYSTMQHPPVLVGVASQPEMHTLPHVLARRFHLP